MNHEVYSMAEHVRRVTAFRRMARESDDDARHRAEGLLVALFLGLAFAACVVAAVVGG